MAEPTSTSGVTYTAAEDGYFEKRGLQRAAGFWGLWGIGVAAVISGQFSGWNFGIGEAGWGGLLIATLLVTIMYFGMLFSIGEMSAAMPHTGGAYSFARASMGPWGGFITGLAETLEYVLTTAVVVYFSAGYADSITDILFGLSLPQWVWWVLLYAVFLVLNIAGAEISFKFAVVVAVISLGVIAFFGLAAVVSGSVDFGRLNDVTPAPGASTFLPHGISGIFFALPFAVWLFLGIEELPLAAEESHTPHEDIPKAGIWGLITLMVSGALVLVLNPAVSGSDHLATDKDDSLEPLLAGFRSIFHDNSNIAALLAAFALVGLLASTQGIMFAYGRNVYSLSRAGYYPKMLSLTGSRKTPYVALLAGGAIGLASLILVKSLGEDPGVTILNMAVWGAVISYMLQMTSYVLLRIKFPNAVRPYQSPVGVGGAVVAGLLGLAVFIGVTTNETYRTSIFAVLVVYAVMLVGFALFGRQRLILSPEEDYALSGGLHARPDVETIPEADATVLRDDS